MSDDIKIIRDVVNAPWVLDPTSVNEALRAENARLEEQVQASGNYIKGAQKRMMDQIIRIEKLEAALNRIDGIAVSIAMLIDAEHEINVDSVLEIRKEARVATTE